MPECPLARITDEGSSETSPAYSINAMMGPYPHTEILFLITVSYNSEDTIERTIKSVLNQTNKNYEYIIVDGASSDKTNEIIESYKKYFNGNLTHISEPDNGIYDAMNKGIILAKGQLICLLNSDDHYFDKTLAIVYDAYINSDLKSVITGELIFKTLCQNLGHGGYRRR